MAKFDWLKSYAETTVNNYIDWQTYNISQDMIVEKATGFLESHSLKADAIGIFDNGKRISASFTYEFATDITMLTLLSDRKVDIQLIVWEDAKLRCSELRQYKGMDFYAPTRIPWPNWLVSMKLLFQEIYNYRNRRSGYNGKEKHKLKLLEDILRLIP